MSVVRRLDRLERLAPRRDGPRLDGAARDAEIERLAAELDAREGPGAFVALLAEREAKMEAASGVDVVDHGRRHARHHASGGDQIAV